MFVANVPLLSKVESRLSLLPLCYQQNNNNNNKTKANAGMIGTGHCNCENGQILFFLFSNAI
jgi:hypothetical protein